MASLSRVKTEIRFNTGLLSLLETLKSIAASQFQALERSRQTLEPFFGAVEGFFALLPLEQIRHPFVSPGGAPRGVIAITSDTGLLGGLNFQVVNAAAQLLQGAGGRLVVVGERGKPYARECGYDPTSFPGIQDDTRYAQAMALRDYCVAEVLGGRLGTIRVVYPYAVSFTQQRVETLTLLPCPSWAPGRSAPSPALLVESEPEALVEYLVCLWVGQKFYELFGESRLAELAARAVHLEGSAQELKRRGRKLHLAYLRGRRELIDRNMRELFSARMSHGYTSH